MGNALFHWVSLPSLTSPEGTRWRRMFFAVELPLCAYTFKPQVVLNTEVFALKILLLTYYHEKNWLWFLLLRKLSYLESYVGDLSYPYIIIKMKHILLIFLLYFLTTQVWNIWFPYVNSQFYCYFVTRRQTSLEKKLNIYLSDKAEMRATILDLLTLKLLMESLFSILYVCSKITLHTWQHCTVAFI